MKKARYMSSWESSLEEDENAKPSLGLPEVFGSHKARERGVNNFLYENHAQPRNHERFLHEQDNGFFTFRLEHREGGVMAQHRGEERILLFRSDRPGAIAKIIFSSTPAPVNSIPSNDAVMDEESELGLMTQAKVHVLDVKEPYRGMDLGGLLFSEAMSSLKHRYHTQGDDQHTLHETSGRAPYSSSIRCQLDAEEDVRRHNKLVHFYEQLGCQKKPKAKVQYLNNNDGETYRKIPMQMALRAQDSEAQQQQQGVRRRKFLASDGSLVNRRGCFLPVQLLDISGASINVPRAGNQSSRQDWLIVDDGEGNIQFRTTHGLYLRADPDGRCFAASVSDDEDSDSDTPPEEWANFRLYRVSDVVQDEFSSDEMESHRENDAQRKELWVLKTAHGTFLAAVPDQHNMYCSKTPAFWQADDDTFNLICTSDTPPRRQHYRKAWIKQTVTYVQAMRERYLCFQLAKMSIREALDRVKSTPFHHFRVARNRADPGPSLRTLCVSTA